MRRTRTSWVTALLALAGVGLALLACDSTGFAAATPTPPPATATPFSPLPVPTNNPPLPTVTPEGSGLVPPTATPVRPTPTSATTPGIATPTTVPCLLRGCPTPIPPGTPTPAGGTPTPTATSGPPAPTPTPCPPTTFSSQTYSQTQIAQSLTNAATANNIPPALLEAEAWVESGWQWNVVACNGDTGLMQMSVATAAWVNQQYGTNDNLLSLDGNAHLGAGFLANYYVYYTSYLQQHDASYCISQPNSVCDWDTVWPNATDNATVRDIVISIYNEGAGTMGKYGILNWGYVIAVLSAFHDRYGGAGG